jgi:lysophospholipase L1-like esterase
MPNASWFRAIGAALVLVACKKAEVAPAASSSTLEEHATIPVADAGVPAIAPGAPSVAASIASPAVGDAGATPGKKRRYAVAALGDSITDPRSGGGGYLRRLGEHCPGSRFVSFGKGGDMVNQMRRRFVQEMFDGSPTDPAGFTHLLVFGGVNDLYSDLSAGRTVEKISTDLRSIYATGRSHGLAVVAVTVAPWGGYKKYFNAARSAATGALNRWILAQRGTAVDFVVDAFPLLSCGDRDFLCAEYEKPFTDGLHFGREGHRRLGDALYHEVFADCL